MAYPIDNPLDGRGAAPQQHIVFTGAPEVFAASLGQVIALLEENLDVLVECHSLLESDDASGARVVPDTVDEEAQPLIAEHKAAIEFLRSLMPTREAA